MKIDLEKVLSNLNEEERAFAEADCAALGMPMGEYLTMAIREGLALARAELGIVAESMPTLH